MNDCKNEFDDKYKEELTAGWCRSTEKEVKDTQSVEHFLGGGFLGDGKLAEAGVMG